MKEAIIAIVSIVIGWGLNVLNDYLADKKKDKRSAKQVLYYLLNIHHSYTSLINPKEVQEMTTYLFTELEATKNDEIPKAVIPMLGQVLGTVLHNISEQSCLEELNSIKEDFHKAVLEFAAQNPNLAFRLNSITDTLHELSKFSKDSNKQIINKIAEGDVNTSDLMQMGSDATMEEFKPKIQEAIIANVEDKINLVAKSVSKKTLNSSKEIIMNRSNNENGRMKKYIKENLDLFNLIVSKFNEHSPV